MFENMDDPQKQALLMMAAGLLSPQDRRLGKGGQFAAALSQGMQGGLMGYNQASQNKHRNAEMEDRGALRKIQMDALRMQAGEAQRQQAFRAAAFKPGVGAMPATPNDDEGNPMPSPMATFDPQAGAAVAPDLAWEMQQKMAKQAPKPMVVGKSLVNPETGQPLYREPDAPKEAKPTFKDYPTKGGIVRVHQDGKSEVIYQAPQEPKEPKESKPTPAQNAVDKAYAKDYLEWTQGGKADADKSISQLGEVAARLGGSDSISGGIVGSIPHSVRSALNMDSADVQDQVEEIVQRNLRLILGAQFTEKEGVRLIARAYNPKLDETTNKRRVDRLLTQISEAANAKQSQAEYYEQNGTLQGWTGKTWTMADFDPEGSSGRKASGAISPPKVMTKADYDKLENGAEYIAPDGTRRRKK